MDETEKRRALAREFCQLSGTLMDVLYALDNARRKAASAGVVFQDGDFTGQAGLKHLTKARIDAGYAAVPTITTAFTNGNFDDTFEAIRS